MAPDDTRKDDSEVPATFQYPLSAVGSALAEHGYAGLTIKKIAAASTRTEAALYRHYDSKDALVEAYLEGAVDWLTWELKRIDATDPVDWLLQACGVLMGDQIDWEQYEGLYAAMQELRGRAPRNEAFGRPLRAYHQFVVQILADVLRDGVEASVFRDLDPEPTAAMIAVLADAVPRYEYVLGLDHEASLVRGRLLNYLSTDVVRDGDVVHDRLSITD